MFRPNNTGLLRRRLAARTITGKEQFAPPQKVAIGVVHLRTGSAPTTVRADSSASRGAADEKISDAKILIPAACEVTVGDVLIVAGIAITIDMIELRFAVSGAFDHREIIGSARANI